MLDKDTISNPNQKNNDLSVGDKKEILLHKRIDQKKIPRNEVLRKLPKVYMTSQMNHKSLQEKQIYANTL